MTVEGSDTPCPDCGTDLQVVYATELEQVVSGWTCPACGFHASDDEVWLLLDPADGSLVDVRAGVEIERGSDTGYDNV